MLTIISPEGLPNSSGNKINKLSPVSGSTVIVKSVPRIATVAESVRIVIFSLGIALNLAVTKRAVPLAKDNANLLLLGLGS